MGPTIGRNTAAVGCVDTAVTSPAPVARLNHAVLYVRDVKRSVAFYRAAFGADWADPLEYHLTVNSGRLGPAAVDLIAEAAGRCWSRSPVPPA